MCRKILVHRMHHDVRTPMITDAQAEDQPVFVNPRHTNFHRCELQIPITDNWLLNSHFPTCQYHSCCVPSVETIYCDVFCQEQAQSGLLAAENEPEECDYFVLEHRHERLEYFGRPDAYNVSYPATWRDDLLDIERDFGQWYQGDWEVIGQWEDQLFFEFERLYTCEEDAKTQFLVYRDLIRIYPPWDYRIRTAESNVERAQQKLLDQKKEVTCLLNWGRGRDYECSSGFIPIWWIRMWAIKDELREKQPL